MPLSAIPLETPGLQHARQIQNVRLQTVVELFNDDSAVSGQGYPRDSAASSCAGSRSTSVITRR